MKKLIIALSLLLISAAGFSQLKRAMPSVISPGDTLVVVQGNDTMLFVSIDHDATAGGSQVIVLNSPWKHYTTTQNIGDATNATADQHYSQIVDMESYLYAGIQLTGSSSGSGVTFKVYATLNSAAATPADGDAAPSADWVDITTAITGYASITLDGGTSGIYFIDNSMVLGRLLFQYEPDNATNSSDIFIKLAY